MKKTLEELKEVVEFVVQVKFGGVWWDFIWDLNTQELAESKTARVAKKTKWRIAKRTFDGKTSTEEFVKYKPTHPNNKEI